MKKLLLLSFMLLGLVSCKKDSSLEPDKCKIENPKMEKPPFPDYLNSVNKIKEIYKTNLKNLNQ
jgi:hypothetical protein